MYNPDIPLILREMKNANLNFPTPYSQAWVKFIEANVDVDNPHPVMATLDGEAVCCIFDCWDNDVDGVGFRECGFPYPTKNGKPC